jgi:hypothetical protein
MARTPLLQLRIFSVRSVTGANGEGLWVEIAGDCRGGDEPLVFADQVHERIDEREVGEGRYGWASAHTLVAVALAAGLAACGIRSP